MRAARDIHAPRHGGDALGQVNQRQCSSVAGIVGAQTAPSIVKQRIEQPLQTPEFPNHDVLPWVGVMSGQYLRCVTGMRQFSDFGGTVMRVAFAPLPLSPLQCNDFYQRPHKQCRRCQ